ncbi:MAG: serine--tRNA ligase [Acidimicrobiaceae bacterium]|nr:serine--tRNA ligase [Acidimicrobiaceae bacterium]
MIDLRKLREDTDYRSGIIHKGVDEKTLDEVLDLDTACRALQAEVEQLRSDQNRASKDIGKASPEEREEKINSAAKIKAELQKVEAKFGEASDGLREIAISIPNPADPRCPTGGEDDYEVIEVVGEQNKPPPMDHAEYGEHMGWVEKEKAAENMGSRFAYLTGEAVLIEFALVQYTLSKLMNHGFTPVVPPVLVREQMMLDAGFFPTDRQQVYELAEDDLYLTGTSEVALAGLHRGDLLDAKNLPIRYGGFSSCFRREAGTYGKDTSGIFRVHQFDKVEMFSFCDPLNSWEELENLRNLEQEILNELELPYRVILVAAGDLGAPAAMKYDCEVWLPSEQKYRELTSCSNYLDYSARRMMTRIRGEESNPLAHTLNGTACAIGRTLVFLMEHYQQDDGSFKVPSVLQPFCGLDVIAPPE